MKQAALGDAIVGLMTSQLAYFYSTIPRGSKSVNMQTFIRNSFPAPLLRNMILAIVINSLSGTLKVVEACQYTREGRCSYVVKTKA